MKAAARTVAAGAAVAISLGSAQAALAAPVPAVVQVPCSAIALATDITGAVSGQTLSLLPSCNYQLTAALPVISKNLTIQGNWATLQRSWRPGTPDFSILTVTSGAVLVLDDLNLRHGDSAGSVILARTGHKDSAATSIGQPVKNSGYGGAIYNENGTVTVNGGTLSDNTASLYGGAIYSLTSLRVNRVLFVGNTSEHGGAIATSFSSPSDIHKDGLVSPAIVTRSTFTANSAYEGGAIYVDDSMAVADSGFTRNTSTDSGGAIYVNDGSPTVTGSYFSQNRSDYGGGIYNDSTLTVTDGSFTDNTARYDGGGIYNEDYATVTATEFRGNQAEDGGGIYNDYQLTVDGATFHQNQAQYGGGIYNDDIATITSSRITDNTASSAGGGIYNDDTVTLTTSVVENNHPDNCAPAASVAGCTG